MREMLSLFMFDLRETFDSIPWTVYFWVFFAFQYFIYAQLISSLVKPSVMTNYYFYYGTGILIIMTFNVSTWAGRRFVEGAHEGRLKYLLSLPFTRGELFLEQVLLGLAVNLIRIGPPLVLLLWLAHDPPIMLVTSVLVLLAMSFGIMGIMISLSFIAFKSFDIFSAIVASTSAVLIRFSTILYPLALMPSAYGTVARFNPLTYGSDLLRDALNFNIPSLLDPEFALFVVAAVGVSTMALGMALVPRALEGVKSS